MHALPINANGISCPYQFDKSTLLGPPSAAGNVSDCRSRGRKLDPGLVPILPWRLIVKQFLWPFLPSTDFRRVVVSYNQRYVHVVLVDCLVQLAKEKSVDR